MKTYARIDAGTVAELLDLDDQVDITECFTPDLVWIDVTAVSPAPGAGWGYKDGAFTPPPGPDLTAARAARKAALEIDRDMACAAHVTVTVGGAPRRWQADPVSRDLVGNAVALGALGIVNPPAAWRTVDNDMVAITLNDLKAIAAAIANQVADAYAHSWQRKAAVDAASTIEQIQAVTW